MLGVPNSAADLWVLFEVFTAVLTFILWNITGRLNIQLIETVKYVRLPSWQVFVTVQLCHGRVSIFPLYTAVSTLRGTAVLAFFLYGRVTVFSCTSVPCNLFFLYGRVTGVYTHRTVGFYKNRI